MKLSESLHNAYSSLPVNKRGELCVEKEWFQELRQAVLDLEAEVHNQRTSNIAGAFARDRFYEALCLVLLRADEPVMIPPHVIRDFKGTSEYFIESNTDLMSGGVTLKIRETKRDIAKKERVDIYA